MLTRQLQRDGSPEAYSDLAKLALVSGDIDRAILMLKRVLEQKWRPARTYNDLAVIYMARQDRLLDLVRALDFLNQALTFDPGFLAARFNKALLLEKLHLPREALKAWDAYLRIDPRSTWSLDARSHVSGLRKLLVNQWPNTRDLLWASLAAGDTARFHDAAINFSQEARTYGEEDLLSGWATCSLSGQTEEATRSLNVARRLGEELASCTGERMLLDAVEAIDQKTLASKANSGKLYLLLKGHSLFRRGLNLYYGRDPDQALGVFEQSAYALSKAGSPFRYWASFFSALCGYYVLDNHSIEISLKYLRLDVSAKPYRSLVGRIHWMLGLIEYEGGDFKSATFNLTSAREIFEQNGEIENLASIYNLLANCLDEMGEHQDSWSMRSLALAYAERLTSLQRLQNIYGQTAAALVRAGYAKVGLTFQNEVIDTLGSQGEPLLKSIGHLQRANILSKMGQQRRAIEDLEAARSNIGKIPSNSQQAKVGIDIILAESRAFTHEPGRAIDLLSSAIDEYVKTGYRFQLVGLFQQRAGYRYNPCGYAAQADRELAMKELARQEENMVNVKDRGLLLETGMAVYDDQIGCFVDRGEFASALMYAEKARVVRSFVVNRTEGNLCKLRQVQQSLPLNTLVVEYALVDDRLVAWLISRNNFTAVSTKVDREFFSNVEKFSDRLSAGVWSRELSRSLFDVLLGHFRAEIATTSRLIIIPDKLLWSLPFSALSDKADNRCLIENHEVVISPSLSWYVRKVRGYSNRPLRRAFALGDPSPNRKVFSGFETLPQAVQEAEAVKSAYPTAVVKIGSGATRAQFIRGLESSDIFVFAGHALDNRDQPWRSALLLAPDSENGDEIGIVYAQDILAMQVRSKIVILSACRTVGMRNQTSRILSGWAQALLEAGVENVVVSYWPIQDAGSQALWARFYETMREDTTVSGALRRAQRSLCEGGCSSPSVRTWGAFGVFGL